MKNKSITLQLRYLRRLTDPEVEMKEKNLQYARVARQLPMDQTALIALDIWDRDLLADMRERDDKITRERIVPVIRACRKAGLQIIHAPTMRIAMRSGNWVNLLKGETPPDRPYPQWQNLAPKRTSQCVLSPQRSQVRRRDQTGVRRNEISRIGETGRRRGGDWQWGGTAPIVRSTENLPSALRGFSHTGLHEFA